MASSSPECPLCLQTYDSSLRTPRTLPCSHISCTSCLLRLSASHDSVIVCPFDRSECKTPVTELPVASSLFKRPRLEESSGLCTLCDDEHPATHRCEDCGELACDYMATAHTKAKATKGHHMTPLPSASSASPTLCAEHNLEFTDFDTQCDIPVCVRCLARSHHSHKCISLHDAAGELRGKLSRDMGVWRKRVERLREMEKLAGENITKLDESQAVAEKTIKDTFQELHSLLTARELTLLDEVASIHKTRSFALSAHLDHVQSLAEGLERVIEEARTFVDQSEAALLAAKQSLAARINAAMTDVLGEGSWEIKVAGTAETVAEAITKAIAVTEEHLPQYLHATQHVQGTYVRGWGSYGSEQGQFSYPTAVAINNSEVFVVDSDNHRVQVFTKDGEYLRQIGTGEEGEGDGEFNLPYGVAISAQKNEVLISDMYNSRIQVFTVDGAFLRSLGTEGSGDGQLWSPTGIALNPQATELYVCDDGNHRVQVLSALDGTYLRKWGSSGKGPGQFHNMEGVAVSEDGQMVCVSDRYIGDAPHRVQVFTPSGQLLHVLGGAEGDGDGMFNTPCSLAFTGFGTLLVCDFNNYCMREMNVVNGTMVRKWGKYGEGQGELNLPCGVAVSEDGEVYVCEYEGHRVQVFV